MIDSVKRVPMDITGETARTLAESVQMVSGDSLLLRVRMHLPEVVPGDDGPLDGGEVADDGEPQHHDLHPCEGDSGDLEGAASELDGDELDQREERGQHDPVRPPEQSGIEPRRSDGLGLGPHVGCQKHPDQRQHPEVRVAPCGAEGHSADHEDIGVPVEDVVEVIALGPGLAGELGDLPVQRVEVSGDDDHEGTHGKEPIHPVPSAEPEHESACEGQYEPRPRDHVGVDVDQLLRHGRQREIHARSLAV